MCSNVAVGADIAVSVGNYVVKRSYCAISRNAAACIQSNFTIVRDKISACSNIFRCIDIYIVVRFYVTGIYAASAGVKNCLTGLCNNIAVGVDIAVSVGNYVIMSIYCALSGNAAACKQIYVSISRSEVTASSDVFRCIDIYCLTSSYVLRSHATCAGVENCFTVCCSNIAIGIDITVSVSNYVIVSLNLSAGRNAAACVQIYVSISRSEVTASSDVFRCVDIYCLTSSYVLGIYAATFRVEHCITICCSNVAVGVDITVSVRNYVIMSIYCAIRCNAAACK